MLVEMFIVRAVNRYSFVSKPKCHSFQKNNEDEISLK